MRLFRVIKWLVVVTLAPLLLLGAYMGINQLRGNFHEVIPGELYRSGQPSDQDIASYSKRYGIKTILNLRNEERADWYARETEAARKSGIEIIDFPMSADRELSLEQSRQLALIMARAQKPLLIHCEHGANRTGLASAIYIGAVKHLGEFSAEFQLSPYYGHIPIKGLGRYQMYRSWDKFEETIDF